MAKLKILLHHSGNDNDWQTKKFHYRQNSLTTSPFFFFFSSHSFTPVEMETYPSTQGKASPLSVKLFDSSHSAGH